MAMLEPKLAILDETDSGLDIDALRIVANGVNKLKAIKRHCSYYTTTKIIRLYRS
jgi:Fe-S cluster assembly ATP-binding protein